LELAERPVEKRYYFNTYNFPVETYYTFAEAVEKAKAFAAIRETDVYICESPVLAATVKFIPGTVEIVPA
jgi:hypothetical protein